MFLQEQEQTQALEYFTQLAKILRSQGIPDEEIYRAIQSQINNPETAALDFPGPVTGIDLAGNQPRLKVPDTGFPPVFIDNPESSTDLIPSVGPHGYLSLPTPDPLGSVRTNTPVYDLSGSNLGHTFNITNFPANPSSNWLGLATDVNSETPTVGVTGYNFDMSVPPWRYDVEQSQSAPINMPPISIEPSGATREAKEQKLMRYVYQGHDNSDICSGYSGKTFDITNRNNRPVPPSEGLGYTNTHPNCICYWEEVKVAEKPDSITTEEKKHIGHVNRVIGQKARRGILHPVKKDGKLSDKLTSRNIRKAQETIGQVNATWLDPDYILAAKESAESNGAKLYLIKAAEETITDHRSEGEPYLRKLAATELQKMVRTAISKGTDINHMGPDFRTGGVIVDGEWDPNMEEMQYLVIESDSEINAAISRGDIDAVSINGGAPRREVVEPCDHNCIGEQCELCTVPVGVILAELDDIGFTWVASRPFMWKGKLIPQATPGIKSTVIQPI